MTTLELKTYESLKAKLGESEAATLLELIDERIRERTNAQKEYLSTKDDLKKIELSIQKEDTRLEILVKLEINRVENRILSLETTVEKGFKEQLKWLIILMFGFSSFIIAIIKLL